MKKITFIVFFVFSILFSTSSGAQCLTATKGLYPSATYTAAVCDGLTANSITTAGYAGEYSNVNVTAGETYAFSSSIATDYITISSDGGVTSTISGVTPVIWVADIDGVVRFYNHADELCAENTTFRSRRVICGVPPCIQPTVVFSKTFDCDNSSFEVIADITDVGDAASITVTDNQGSAAQSVSSANAVTFGPYPFGTAVVLTATNDQTPICNVVSTSQNVLACPPANDEYSNAIALIVNPGAICTDATQGTIVAATGSIIDTAACGGTEDDDVWFSFEATSTSHNINLNNVAGSTTDLYHSLWYEDNGALVLVPNSCSDPNNSTPSGLTIAKTYYLRVYSWTATAGQTSTFDVCIGTPPGPPANDEYVDAIALTVNPDAVCTDVTPGTIYSATASLTDTASCFGTEDDDVWFSFVATNTAHIINLNNVLGSTTDLFHSLWYEDNGALVLVPNTCSDPNSSTPSGLTVGTTYYLRVYSYTATTGQTSTFDVCIGTPPPPPANDEFVDATPLTVNPDAVCTDVTPGTIFSATASNVNATACGGTEDDDVWFSFVATNTAHIINLNNVAGSTTDLYHSLWYEDNGTLLLVPNSCSDPNFSSPSGLTVGTTYYLRVYSWTATTGQTSTFDVCIGTPPPPPANDECENAIVLTVNPDASCASFESGTIASATASITDAASCVGTEDDDVWFSFVASDVLQSITISNIVGSTTDLNHSVWTGDCGSLTLVPGTCSDPNASTPTGLTAGETYYIRVYSATATTGQTSSFDICVGTPPPPPANDDCTGAIELTAGGEFVTNSVIGSNVSSTTAAGLPTFGCQTNRSNDVWYSVVVPASGSITIETNSVVGSPMTDSVISIYRGECGALIEVGCDDDSSPDGLFSKKSVTGNPDVLPGSTLYIGVWRYSLGAGTNGDFQISAYDASLLSNDTFDTSSFKAYPNPVKDILKLSYNKTISNVSVYNLLGQEVMTKSANDNQSQVDMSNLAIGTYLVKVTADNQVKTIKVIKE